MVPRKVGSAWEVLAPAKLNLYLEVLGRRSDGFHELETLMTPISVYDRLFWNPTGSQSGASASLAYHWSTRAKLASAAPPDDSNLVLKAARRLAETAGVRPYGAFTLQKQIPAQAGLGGGSSDAAAALLLANAAWGLNFSLDKLAQISCEIGSDVPFFLVGGPAVCRGRGEIIEALPDLPPLHVVVAAPAAGLSTAEVFRETAASPSPYGVQAPSTVRLSRLIDALRVSRLSELGRLSFNRLEAVAARMSPAIQRLREEFLRLPWHSCGMSGSGSAYFGVARTAQSARRAARYLSSRGLGTVFAATTCRP